jgi:putative membrane protein
MNVLKVMSILVAVLHLYFLALEMFFWTKPLGRKVFRTTPEFAEQSAALAANQGLYNGFLAAGLLWGVLHADPFFGRQIQMFFLACVVAAGILGALTVSKRILYVQSMPALIGLVAGFWR